MFYSEFKKESTIDLTDYDSKVVEEFLRYIYCGTAYLTLENALLLIDLSRQFMIKGLTNFCVDFLVEKTEKDAKKLLQVYNQAVFLEEHEFIKQCLLKIKQHSKKLFESENELLLTLSKEAMKNLVDSDELMVYEPEIFEKVLQWICRNVRNGDKMKAFDEFKLLIRFPIMPVDELLGSVCDSKMLSDAEIVALLKYKQYGPKIETPFKTIQRNHSIRGIQTGLLFSYLIKLGWNVVYRNDQCYFTRKEELLRLKVNDYKGRLLCVCSKKKNYDYICLAAIDTMENVLEKTTDCNVVSKGGVEGLYWYFVEDHSFGFSNELKINLKNSFCDKEKGYQRLSWALSHNGRDPIYRVGDLSVKDSGQYDNDGNLICKNWENIILIL
ncbi:hypothetical protein ABK040_008696 [Willaertia magna]